ncbi:MAG: phospholipase D-like domain-containing protein [Chloroflexota bacterium]
MSAKKTSSKSTSTNPVLVIIIVLIVACLGAVYIFTGSDPFGLFTPTDVSPAATLAPATAVVEPSQAARSTPEAQSGDWWQVYFTDPNTINDPDNLAGSIPEKLIEYIDGAQHSIHIAAFEFNLTPVAEALIAAHKRGVEVRWITDDEYGIQADEEDGRGQFAMLKKAKIEVKDDQRSGLMHDKFLIFDGRYVWTGSTNLTVNGNFRNNNNVIVIDSPDLAAVFERQFADMWAGNFGPASPSSIDQQLVKIARTPIQALFSPEDDVISHLVPYIQGAQKSIRIMAFSFTHDDLEAAVLERFKAGVDVKAIFETRGSETEYSALPLFYCAKMPARQDGNPGTFHHKVIIIDEHILITGSLNFTNNADESNNENTLVITRADIAKLYVKEFERRWAEATDPERSAMKCK